MMNIKTTKSLLYAVAVLCFAPVCFATGLETGTIAGRIIDQETGEALPGANVLISRTLLGTSANSNGRFRMSGVPAGDRVVRISFVGYGSKKINVKINPGDTTAVEVALKSSAILFDQVVVTGSRQTEDLQAAANSVSVLSSAEIRQRDRFRIDQALETVPGVDLIGENVTIRGGTGYSLLGLGGSRVLMLIDDVPVLTSDLGRANWDILPVTELERVEVLKGAASVLYGSGGISGVVNVITRRPTEIPRISFRQSVGIYSEPSVSQWDWTDKRLWFYRSDVSLSDTFGPVGVRLAVSRHYSTSDRQNGEFERWYFTLKPTIQFGDGSNLSLFATYNRDDRGFFLQWRDQNHALETNFPDRINVDGFAASAIYNRLFTPTFAMKARFSFNSQLIGLPFNISSDFNPALGLSGELQGNWMPNDEHQLTFGLDYRRDIVEAKYYGEHKADAFSPYLQETWKLVDDWQISAGLRYDNYLLVGDSLETQVSPKVGMSYSPFDETIVHASFGRGFRAPSIGERFSTSEPDDIVRLVSNPGLVPERSTLFDLGVRQRLGDSFSFEVTAFRSEYSNLIELTQISDQRLDFQFRNCPDTRVQGLESEIRYRFWNDHFGIRANAMWLHSRSEESDQFCRLVEGEPLPYRAKWNVFFSPSFQYGPVTVEADYRYVSRFERVSFFPLDERVPQEVVDLRASFQWQEYKVMFQVRNLINYNYTVVEKNLGETRNFSLSLSGEI